MKKISTFLLLLIFYQINAQKNTSNKTEILDTIQLTGYEQARNLNKIAKTVHIIRLNDAELQSIESIDELLQTIASIDIRSRGSKGVQSDISIRGGTFEQVLILLNGIKINNPQTGHHNLDIPIDFNMLERIEIIEGATGHIFGTNAYSGVINLITKKNNNKQATSSLKMGQYGYIKTNFNIANSINNLSAYNSLSYNRSDGYLNKDSINNTDFNIIKYYINLQYNTPKFPIYLQAGYQQKDFGANSFYTAKFPWQYEKTQGFFAAVNSHFGKKIKWEPYLSYRLHYDEFQLFRESIYQYNNEYFIHQQDTAQYAPGIYYRGHNYHKTQTLTAGINGKFKNKWGYTNIHFGWENHSIFSNRLGKLLSEPIVVNRRITYTYFDERNYYETGINHSKKWEKFQIGGGLNILYNRIFKTQFNGGLYLNFLTPLSTHFISISSSSRLPSFTDLYYSGPQNIGNPNLKPETAITWEVGNKWKYKNIQTNMSVFYRKAKNTIDWIKYQPSDKWQTKNLTTLNTYGIESSFKLFFKQKFINQFKLSYTYLYMEKMNNTNIISKYSLDYLKHKLNIDVSHRFLYKTKVNWMFMYKNRNGVYLNYVNNQYQLFNYQPYFLTNVKITKQVNKLRFGLSIENLFDIDYNDLSYIKMPGRWVILELKYKIY